MTLASAGLASACRRGGGSGPARKSDRNSVEVKNMSRVCSICNKGQVAGNNVSHSNRKTRRTFKANVQKVKIVKEGKVESAYVCARCLKSDKVERV